MRYGSRTHAFSLQWVYDLSVAKNITNITSGCEVYMNAKDLYRHGYIHKHMVVERYQEIRDPKIGYLNENVNYLNITYFDDFTLDQELV